MNNAGLDKKRVRIVIIGLVVILFILIGLVNTIRGRFKTEKTEIAEAQKVAYADNKKIIHYSGDIYCYTNNYDNGETSFVLLRLPTEFEASTKRNVIQKFSYLGERINIYFEDDRIFYLFDGKTYIYDIAKNTSNLFCDGELQFFIDETSFVTFYGGNLYKGELYPNSFITREYKQLTKGSFYVVGEDEKKLYMGAKSKSNTLIVALDKETLNIHILDNYETRKRELKGVKIGENYIYEVLDKDGHYSIRRLPLKTRNGNERIEYETVFDEQSNEIELADSKYFIDLNEGNDKSKSDDLYFFVKEYALYDKTNIDYDSYTDSSAYIDQYYLKNTTAYKYDAATNKVSLYDGEYNELWLDNYSISSSNGVVSIYYKEKLFTTVETNIKSDDAEIEMKYTSLLGEYLYYEFSINDGENMEIILARTLKEGGKSDKINITKPIYENIGTVENTENEIDIQDESGDINEDIR